MPQRVGDGKHEVPQRSQRAAAHHAQAGQQMALLDVGPQLQPAVVERLPGRSQRLQVTHEDAALSGGADVDGHGGVAIGDRTRV